MEELENLKNNHSRMLFLISQMYRDNEITREVKINLKYLVFLNDANLLGVLKKGYTNIEDLKKEIKIIGKNLDHEDLEEEFKNADMFNFNQDNNTVPNATPQEEGNEMLAGQTSPISSFLQEAKKRKQRNDQPVDNFHIEQAARNTQDTDTNPLIKECDFGASPKVTVTSRRKR